MGFQEDLSQCTNSVATFLVNISPLHLSKRRQQWMASLAGIGSVLILLQHFPVTSQMETFSRAPDENDASQGVKYTRDLMFGLYREFDKAHDGDDFGSNVYIDIASNTQSCKIYAEDSTAANIANFPMFIKGAEDACNAVRPTILYGEFPLSIIVLLLMMTWPNHMADGGTEEQKVKYQVWGMMAAAASLLLTIIACVPLAMNAQVIHDSTARTGFVDTGAFSTGLVVSGCIVAAYLGLCILSFVRAHHGPSTKGSDTTYGGN